MAILPDTTLSQGDMERTKGPLAVALAKLHAAITAWLMEIQQDSYLGVRHRASGDVHRALEEVDKLIKGRNDLPDEIIKEIKGARTRFPKCSEA